MNPKEFFDKVCRMRKAQKEYFRTRSGRALSDSKRLEKEIDDEIERRNGVCKQRGYDGVCAKRIRIPQGDRRGDCRILQKER